MKILVTNDDGIHAEGIRVLFDVLSLSFDTYMIAPDSERSGCSNAFTIHRAMVLKKEGDKQFSLNGFPADCVNVGLHGDIIPPVDLIVSGINHGPNLGDDLFFSGTVAGARTAYIFGKNGIALSMDSYHRPSEYFKEASLFLVSFIHELILQKNRPWFFNINYPDIPMEEVRGMQYTVPCKRLYRDTYMKEHINTHEMQVRLEGDIESVAPEGSDMDVVKKGYISVTPLSIDCTDHAFLSTVAGGDLRRE